MPALQVATSDEHDHIQGPPRVPVSPPPPFSSRPTSPSASDRLLGRQDPLDDDEDRTLAEAFDTPGGSDDEDDEDDDRRRLVRDDRRPAAAEASSARAAPAVETSIAQYPAFATTTNRLYGSGRANDGVFANLSAKPSQGEEVDEKPPVCPSVMYKSLLTL
jgi:hypothetical protein